MKIQTDCAILMFYDKSRDEPRRVLFGGPDVLIEFLEDQIPEVIRSLETTAVPDGITRHNFDVMDKGVLEIEYKVRK